MKNKYILFVFLIQETIVFFSNTEMVTLDGNK